MNLSFGVHFLYSPADHIRIWRQRPGHLHIDMPGHSKIPSTQLNSTLPSSEPLQRNRILLLGCLPLLSLAQQTQHDPRSSSKHVHLHVPTDNVSWLNPAVQQVLSRYWVFRSKSRGLQVAVSLVENDVMPTLPLQQLGATYMVKWVKSRRRKKCTLKRSRKLHKSSVHNTSDFVCCRPEYVNEEILFNRHILVGIYGLHKPTLRAKNHTSNSDISQQILPTSTQYLSNSICPVRKHEIGKFRSFLFALKFRFSPTDNFLAKPLNIGIHTNRRSSVGHHITPEFQRTN
jgi:hypothetical protein